MPLRFYIDTHKGSTALVVLMLIAVFGQWQNATAWVYLALHGSYGLMWVAKSHFFPDKQWQRRVSLIYGLLGAWGGLSLYWIAPLLLTWRGVQAPGWYLALCVSLWGFGVFWHFTADMQKYVSLSLQPHTLFTGGLWARLRNPNYLGELFIYMSFALLAMHWAPIAILAAWVVFYWLPNMRRKDRSLARYAEFADWKKRSWLFLPYLY